MDTLNDTSLQALIKQHEEMLRIAMLNSDVEVLNVLIADSLEFTLPNGQKASKEDDLNSHRSGILDIKEISIINQYIDSSTPNKIFVTTETEVKGTLGGEDMSGRFLYKRTWSSINERYQITKGSCSKL